VKGETQNMPTKAELQRQIEELKKSEQQYRTLIENHPYGIHENDAEGIITYANPAFHQMFNYPEGESAIGRPMWATLPTEEQRQEMRQYLGYLADQQPPAEPYESKSWTVDGKPLDTRVDWDYQLDEEGQVVGFISVVTDITELKKAAEEQARLQQEVIEAQQRAIKELSTPVIPLMETSQGGILVMPLVGSIDSLRAKDLMRTLLAGISEHRAKVVILDVTGVPIVDSGVANHLNKTIMAARLKGARTIVTGITDAVAETIVDLGIDWSGIETLSDLQTGLVTALGSLGIKLSQSR